MSFTIRKIQMDLSPGSIENAIREVKHIQEKLKPAMMYLISHLAEKGVEIARAELIFFEDPAYYTGELSESIRGVVNKDGTGTIIADCDYAIYVEYGTGEFFDDGNEDGVGRSGKPMHYMNGWFYFNERDGKFHGTTGMPPRPFMHNTLMDLEEEAKAAGGRIIAEYLRDF